jgi:flavin-dependent dehydrogenase
MFDPIEIHLGVQLKWSWSSFYQPDKFSPYYYSFAYPLDGAVTLGVYYQLTKRRGHTRAALRRMARDMVAEEKAMEPERREVNGKDGNTRSQSR